MASTFRIPKSKLNQVIRRLEKAANRARLVNLPIPSLKIVSEEFIDNEYADVFSHINGSGKSTRTLQSVEVVVEIDNFTPNVGDWSFIGTRKIVHDRIRAGYKLGTFGVVPNEIKDRQQICCDHCGYKRKRSFSWIVKNNLDNKVYEVGSTCVEPFTGYELGAKFCNGMNEVGSALHEIQSYSDLDPKLDPRNLKEQVKTVLAVAYNRLMSEEFVSSHTEKNEGATATWRSVWSDLENFRQDGFDANNLLLTEFDFLMADEIMNWYADLHTGQFVSAVQGVINNGFASYIEVALLAAATNNYIKQIKYEQEREGKRNIAISSQYVSNTGDKIDFVGKVLDIKMYETRFGMASYITIIDDDDNLLRWKASGVTSLQIGMAYEMRGTIKELKICNTGMFEGIKETIVTRVKTTKDLGPVDFVSVLNGLSSADEEALNTLIGLG